MEEEFSDEEMKIHRSLQTVLTLSPNPKSPTSFSFLQDALGTVCSVGGVQHIMKELHNAQINN